MVHKTIAGGWSDTYRLNLESKYLASEILVDGVTLTG